MQSGNCNIKGQNSGFHMLFPWEGTTEICELEGILGVSLCSITNITCGRHIFSPHYSAPSVIPVNMLCDMAQRTL